MTTPDPLLPLSKDELSLVTGVKPGAHDRVDKMVEVLKEAGIHYWLGWDGQLKTTRHHISVAGARVEQQAPTRFGRPDMSKVK